MIKIIVVDDDSLVAMSLVTIISADPEIRVLAQGASGAEAVKLYTEHRPDILLMDIRMDGMNGLEAAEAILKAYPDAKILFLTTFSDDEYISKALVLGVKGYILKQNFEGIVPALKAVYGGQNVFGGEIVGKMPKKESTVIDLSEYDISEREQRIIELVADGLSNKEIAERLFLGEGTVRNYISTILEKLDLRDRTQLAVFYYKNVK